MLAATTSTKTRKSFQNIAAAKVVQGERKAKKQSEDLLLALPNRRLLYQKVVQGERSRKHKAKGFMFFKFRIYGKALKGRHNLA